MNIPDAPWTVLNVQDSLLKENIDDKAFLEHIRQRIHESPSAVLLSGGNPETAHYSIAAFDPFLIFHSRNDLCEFQTHGEHFSVTANPLEALDHLFRCIIYKGPSFSPFAGGAIGYLAYELKNSVETLPQTTTNNLDLPDIYLFFPSALFIHDRLNLTIRQLSLSVEDAAERKIPGIPPVMSRKKETGKTDSMRINFSRNEYLDAVEKVRQYIIEGDIYQANLSQRFQFPFHGDAFKLWMDLYFSNPAPYYAFINAADHLILSTSMECFLRGENGLIESQPIKGTRKRGAAPEEDEFLRADLLSNPKEDAELSMIVDLVRNDLGRICEAGSIRISEHKRLDAYKNVSHISSVISGKLRPELSYSDIIRATFPAGSITGCPKIRAMEIIDELERNARHVYTGAIGFLGYHGNFHLNVAIRTAIMKNDQCYFSVGGGIVYDSKAEDEYEETLHKGKAFFDVVTKISNTKNE